MSRANPRFRRINPVAAAAPANTWQLLVRGLIENQLTVNDFYFSDGGAALVAGSEANLISGFLTTYSTTLKAAISQDWSWVDCKVQCLTSPTRQPVVSAVNGFGTGAAGHEPTEIAAVIIKYSTLRGQCGRGRLGLPAVPTGSVLASNITVGAIGAYNALATIMAQTFIQGGVTYTPGVYSRGTRTSGVSKGFSVMTTCVAKTLLGTIRRRKVGRGK